MTQVTVDETTISARSRERADASADVDRESAEVFADHLALTGVHAASQLDPELSARVQSMADARCGQNASGTRRLCSRSAASADITRPPLRGHRLRDPRR